MKKIVILFNLNRQQYEYETEFDSIYTIDSIFNVLNKKYIVEKLEADKKFKWIDKLQKINPDLVFNICEGYYGPARESVYAAILEQLGFNYTGPDSTNLLICHNKFLAKHLLKKYILTPNGYIIKDKNDLIKLNNLKYPLIVKLNSEGSSMGMTNKSIVHNKKELNNEVDKLLEKYNRGVLIEEYIAGKDISMIYIEGIGALGPCEVNCNSQFYDYEMKSSKDNTVDILPLNGNYEILKDIVVNIVKLLDIKGYAKLDFRVSDNDFYLIEVNAQVSFHPEGEFITCAKKDKYSFEQIVNFIVEYAINRKVIKNSVGIIEEEI